MDTFPPKEITCWTLRPQTLIFLRLLERVWVAKAEIFNRVLAFADWTSVPSAKQIHFSSMVLKCLVKSKKAVGIGRIKIWEPMSFASYWLFSTWSYVIFEWIVLYKLHKIKHFAALSQRVYCILFFREKLLPQQSSGQLLILSKRCLYRKSLFQAFLKDWASLGKWKGKV